MNICGAGKPLAVAGSRWIGAVLLLTVFEFGFALSACAQSCMTWIARTNVGSPGQRAHHAMAFDSNRGVTVFFGGEIGETGSETYFNDTQEYDGTQWRQITINGASPPARSFHAMTFNNNDGTVMLYGGHAGGMAFQDMWVYSHSGANATWTQVIREEPGPPAGGARDGL